jgi:outer membrane immunogenic protein
MNMRFLVTAAFAAVMFTGVANAADLPRKMPVKAVPVAVPFSWTGFYVGAHGGGGWGNNDWQDFVDPLNPTNATPGPDASYNMSGALAGGQIGYNWQTGWTVFGIEADASWADIKGSGNNAPQVFAGFPSGGVPTCMQMQADGCSSKIEALGTITGRVGAAFDHTLLYVKGGAAWGITKHTVGGVGLVGLGIGPISASTSETRWGWTIGAGVEYAFAANWSVKAEYNYIDLGTERVNFVYQPTQFFGASANLEQVLHVAKAGVNYRF